MAQRVKDLIFMRMWVRSLASLSGKDPTVLLAMV